MGQKLSQAGAGEWVSVSEFARRAECDRKQVQRAVAKGLIKQREDGFLDAAQATGQWRKPNRRTVMNRVRQPGATKGATKGATTEVVPPPATTGEEETPAEAAERIVAENPLLSLDQALQLKENYLGRLKQLEYDLKAGSVHVSATCARHVGERMARVRTRMLAIPAERAPALHRLKTVVEVEDLLRSVITEALQELTGERAPAS